ncbi:MAG: S53 family serine peptidase [Acidobacteriia bacterium]|nr:S53 family serine peptidase [Terriglobia bacterium]
MPRTPVCPSRKSFFVSIFAFILTLIVLAGAAPAQTRNRITQRIADTEPVVVSMPHPLARAAFDQGRVEGSMNINHAAIVFKLAPAQQADLDKLLAEQQDPHSANYRQWLTPEQYAARFGMSDSDLAQVTSWLKSQGLTVDGFSRARTRVFFSGTAAQVESVFHTELHRYLVNGQVGLANATEISVPQAISAMVLGVRGLENFRPLPRARVARPNFTSHVSGSHFVSPGDFATIYNLSPLYSAGLDGTGETIAVVGQTQIHTADIDAFRTAAGLPPKNLQLVAVNGTGFSAGDEVEADLDVEWSGAVARNATILYVYTGSNSSQNVFNALEYAIDHNLAPVISTSYGNCEANLGSFTATLRADVQQANSQGQTVMAASGDAGAADCEDQTAKSATHGLAVDSPGSVPEVTALGGSEFTGDAASTVTGGDASADPPFWGATTGGSDNVSSALAYIPEMGWNDTAASIATPSGGLSASGGGVSAVFAKPAWQTALTPADGHRDVPDVSLTASPNHDGSLVCSQAAVTSSGSSATSCSAGFRDSAGNLSPVGGTSVGAPAFAGIVAILNQATQSGGLGNINPTLYSLGGTGAFHDITTGNNIVPCTSGTPTGGSASLRCPTSAPFQIGYSAAAGYDLVTGLGSVNANVLATSWPGFVLTPNFSVGGTPVSVASPGQGGTSTVTVTPTNGFVGTVDLACALTPASTTAGVTCNIPASVSVNGSSQTASLTISTTAPHVLSGASTLLPGQHGLGWLGASSALFAGICFLGVPSRRRRRVAGFGLMLLVFFSAGVGCGGGSSSSGSAKTGGTPAGSYSITVTATSGSLSHTANVAVTVQ